MPATDMSTTPILLTRRQAADALGIGLRTLGRLEAAGMVGPRPVKLGGRVQYNADELRQWASSANGSALPGRDEWINRKVP